MYELSDLFTENDFRYLIKTLMPKTTDVSHMVATLKEDRDILEGMLSDPTLLKKFIRSSQEFIKVSPQLLFAVLVAGVRRDLVNLSFTVEHSTRETVAVFDVQLVKEFLEDPRIRTYLIDMLSSFVHINSFSVPVRIRKGIWYKYRFSDFNIESLVRYSELQEPDRRFPTLKRVGDLCLFLIGVFPESLQSSLSPLQGGRSPKSELRKKTREELTKIGKQFYESASKHESAVQLDMDEVLESLGSHFELAAKPLTLMADNYLAHLKKDVFAE